ncbi:MAG: tetratricopeptide repeat protein [Microscillaceae bacterium]|nr:tetratricopeptide repeat protein [Microscillaceae bacterium]
MLKRCSLISFLSVFTFLLTIPALLIAQNGDQTAYEKAYKQAIKYFDSQENDKGYEYLNKAIGLNPSFYDALYARSYYLMQDGAYEKAIEDYQLLIGMQSDNPLLYLYLGQAYLHTEDFKQAEENYLKAYELDSNDVDITNSLGSLYFVLDLYLDAQYYLDKSVAIAPNNLFAFYYRAYTAYYLEDYDKALADISTALSLAPEDIDSFRLKALIFLAQKKYKSSISVYENLQKLNIDFEIDDFYHWGKAYYALNNFADAEFYFELPENHQNAQVYHYLGKTKYKLNNSKEALMQLNRAIEFSDTLDENTAPVYYDRAIVKYRLKDLAGAEKDFFYANYLVPEIIRQENFRGEKLDLLEDAFTMLKMESRQKDLDSIHVSGYQDRAGVFISSGDLNKAVKEIKKALQIDSTNSYTFTTLATATAMQGKFDEALGYLNQAMQLKKNQVSENNYYIQSLIFGELGKLDAAIESLEKAISINKKRAVYFSDLANFYYESQNVALALQNIQEAIRLEPDDIEHYNDRAFFYVALGKLQEAISDCDRVLQNDPENVIAFYNRGLAYRGLKEYKKALADFEKVLEYAPEDEEVKLLLQEIKKEMEAD